MIPIVTTAEQIDAVTLAQTYIHRWPAQENVIKDFLLPLGLDVNHGFAKTPVINSEVNKKREALEKRCANVQRFREAARPPGSSKHQERDMEKRYIGPSMSGYRRWKRKGSQRGRIVLSAGS